MPVFLQLLCYFNGAAQAIDRVVSVHQEHAVVRQRLCINLKCLGLLFEKHDPTVRLRAANWNFVLLARLQVRCAGAAADESRSRRAQTPVNSLCATQTKFNYRVILSR